MLTVTCKDGEPYLIAFPIRQILLDPSCSNMQYSSTEA